MQTLRDLLPARIGHGWTFYRISEYGGNVADDGFRWRDLTEVRGPTDADFVSHQYLSRIGLQRGAMVRANQKDVESYDVAASRWGAYNSREIVFRIDAPSDSAESILEILQGLDDYPIVDESTLSELEMEDEIKAWADFGASDFRRSIAEQHEIDRDDVTEDVSLLSETFYEIDGGRGFVVHEETGPYFDTDRVAKETDIGDLILDGIVTIAEPSEDVARRIRDSFEKRHGRQGTFKFPAE